MNDVCKSIPETLNEEVHGYHRSCYNKFIKNKDRFVQLDTGESSDGSGKSSRRSSSDNILLQRTASFIKKKDENGIERSEKDQFQRKQLCLI